MERTHDDRALDDSSTNEQQRVSSPAAPSASRENDSSDAMLPLTSLAAEQPTPPTVVVNLKFIHRERLSSVHCAPDIRVTDLKQLALGIYAHDVASDNSSSNEQDVLSIASLRLIYKGKVLKDDQSLASYGFVSHDTLHAVIARSQPPSASPPSSTSSSSSSAQPTASSSSASGTTQASPSAPRDQFAVSQISVDIEDGSPLTDFTNQLVSMLAGITGLTVVDSAASRPAPPASSSSPSTATSSTPASTPPTDLRVPHVPLSAIPPVPVVTPASVQQPPARPTASATSLLNHAASLRRLMPALELIPLSQPPELSDEMYALGNAMREASDTFLALHRQLQFVATRFLTEHSLSASERLRLRTRVQQLVPILDHVSTMSRSVANNLEASSYGSSATAAGVPAPPQQPHPPAATPTAPSPSARQPSSSPPPAPPASVSIAPTVNVFSGSSSSGHAASVASSIGNSIVDVLQAVSTLRSGGSRPPAAGAQARASTETDGLDSILNMVAALTTGTRPATTAPPTSGVNGPQATPSTQHSAPAPVVAQSAAGAAASDAEQAPARPLSALFTQV